MALIKQKQLNNGAVVNYWRVDMINVNKGSKEASFALMGYYSREVAENHPNDFIDCIGVNDLLMADDKELYLTYFNSKGHNFKDVDTACYVYAKNYVEFFKDAQDDEQEKVTLI